MSRPLFSVNAATASLVPRLFARNERVLTFFDGAFGEFALILVGALNVGSIATVLGGDCHAGGAAGGDHRCRLRMSPSTGRGIRPLQHGFHRDPAVFKESRPLA